MFRAGQGSARPGSCPAHRRERDTSGEGDESEHGPPSPESWFTPFEVLSYIVPGAVVLYGLLLNYPPLDSLEETGNYLSDIGPAAVLFYAGLLIAAYVVGQIVSALGSVVIHRLIVVPLWGDPIDNLFREGGRRSALFPGYVASYTPSFKEEWHRLFLGRFEREYGPMDRFLLCLHDVKENTRNTMARLERHIRLYEFARNLSAAFLVLTVALATRWAAGRELLWVGAALASFGMALALLPRYLRFYRSYSDEVFQTFFILSKDRERAAHRHSGGS